MRKSFYCVFLFLTSLFVSINASAEVTGIQVSDGDKNIIFYIDERPEVNFTDTDLVVTGGHKQISYPMTSTVTFDFINGAAVENINVESTSFSISSSEILAAGLQCNELVQIFSMTGQLVYSSCADEVGEFRLPNDVLPKEPLIIKTNKFVYKFLSF